MKEISGGSRRGPPLAEIPSQLSLWLGPGARKISAGACEEFGSGSVPQQHSGSSLSPRPLGEGGGLFS